MEFPSPTAGSCTGLAWLRGTLSDTATNDTPKQNIITGSIVVSSLDADHNEPQHPPASRSFTCFQTAHTHTHPTSGQVNKLPRYQVARQRCRRVALRGFRRRAERRVVMVFWCCTCCVALCQRPRATANDAKQRKASKQHLHAPYQ